MEPLRLGVLSTARIAVKKVIPAVAKTEACNVVALASRDPERGAVVADSLDIPRVHRSYEALLADPEVDAVYIPLPNHLHAGWTIAAAEAGKHVLCEKPLAMSPAEGRRMIDSCRAFGVVLMEAYMYRLHPQWVRTMEIVASGALGAVRAIQTYFAYRNLDPANIRNRADCGGGALMDIGCYPIDLSRMLYGEEPVQVEGALLVDQAMGVDVVTSGLLTFPDGGHSSFVCATQSEPGQWVHVIGTEGRLTVEVPFNAPPDEPTRLSVVVGQRAETIELPPADQYTIQAEAFAAAVRDGGPPPVGPESGVATLEVMERLRGAAAGRT